MGDDGREEEFLAPFALASAPLESNGDACVEDAFGADLNFIVHCGKGSLFEINRERYIQERRGERENQNEWCNKKQVCSITKYNW